MHRGTSKKRDDPNRDWIRYGTPPTGDEMEGQSYCDATGIQPDWAENAFQWSKSARKTPQWNWYIMYQPRPPPGTRLTAEPNASPYRIIQDGDCRSKGWFFIETPQECRVAATQLNIARMTQMNWPDHRTPNGKWSMLLPLRNRIYSAQQKLTYNNLYLSGLLDDNGKKNFEKEKLRIYQAIDEENRIFWNLQPFCGTQDRNSVLGFNWLGWKGVPQLQGAPGWRHIFPAATKDRWQICRTTGGPLYGGKVITEWKEAIKTITKSKKKDAVEPPIKREISGLSFTQAQSYAESQSARLMKCPDLRIHLRNMAMVADAPAFDVRVNQASQQWAPCETVGTKV